MEYWKVGRLEGWKVGRLVFKRIFAISNFIVNTNSTINPILHYPRTHYSIIPEPIIPLFQHSTIPPFQLGLSP
jgi:hypothetical protein